MTHASLDRLPFCMSHEVSIKGSFLHALHRCFINDILGLNSPHLGIRHHKQPMHILYSFQIRSYIKAVEPLERLVTILPLLSAFQP